MEAEAGTEVEERRPTSRAARVAADIIGTVVVLAFARATIRSYEQTHRLMGAAFIAQQVCVAIAFLVRRPPSSASRRPSDWITTLGGSFGGFLLRPGGIQTAFTAGQIVQISGLAVWVISFFALGRSFGLVAANRGIVTRGPYRVVRHPLYASYMVTQFGYLLQSASAWNIAVLTLTWTCQIARAKAEERWLADSPTYGAYREHVRWRLLPAIW
jgi:protein-S-isoprenylcysteine O-methyltransferase Ste14